MLREAVHILHEALRAHAAGVRHEDRALEVLLFHDDGHCFDRCFGRSAFVLHEDGRIWHSVAQRVVAADGGLAGRVADTGAAGDDQARREPAMPEIERVIEPRT